MNASGLRQAPEITQRAVVLAAIASLHILIIHLLTTGAGNHGSFGDSVIEADILPTDRRLPNPPAYPQIVFQASSRLNLPLLQVAIDPTADQDPPPTSGAVNLDLHTESVAADPAPTAEIELIPVLSPRPITGPRGIDRYPNESMRARESGTVTINICVSREGHVDSVALTHSSGFPRLDAVALGIASEYQFKPALRLGHPVAACDQYRIVFKVI